MGHARSHDEEKKKKTLTTSNEIGSLTPSATSRGAQETGVQRQR